MNLPNGTLLQGGKYKIERMLGQGGFGITYRATHMALGTQVAIKEFFLNGVNGRGADNKSVTVSLEVNRDGFTSQRNKFRKEAQRLQSLSSDHIVKVYDYFDENGTSYYVMEHIDGSSLDQWAKHNGGRLSESQVTDVFNQTLSALQVMHNRNIWHLDIKPNNIMRTSNGIIKLIDFGASKMIDSDHTMTTSSAIAHTPGFAPLEQMAGDMSSFGPWTDFYALGATLYVLLTGNRPPTANDILSNGFASFAWPSVVTSDIRRVIVAMMNPIRNKRPQNVAEVKQLVQQQGNYSDIGPMDERINPDKWESMDGEKTVIGGHQSYIADSSGILVTLHRLSFDMVHFRLSFRMVHVKGGSMIMEEGGSSGLFSFMSSVTRKEVTLTDYYIGEIPVTQELWRAIMENNPSVNQGDKKPVDSVNWNDCMAFIYNLNKITRLEFSLPTEAQWEFAARGGNNSRSFKYAGNNNADYVAWHWKNSGHQSQDVAKKLPNELGIFDMSGNIAEWCADFFDGYKSGAENNPQGPPRGSDHVIRGGSWSTDEKLCRVVARDHKLPSCKSHSIGFRLVINKLI